MKLRTLLFAPGDSERKAEKALASEADGVILDLEEFGCSRGRKTPRRAATAAMLPQLSRPGVVVRVNPIGTPWYLADLAAVVRGKPAAIMLPKCTGPGDLRTLDHHLDILETAAGLPVARSRFCRWSRRPRPPCRTWLMPACHRG